MFASFSKSSFEFLRSEIQVFGNSAQESNGSVYYFVSVVSSFKNDCDCELKLISVGTLRTETESLADPDSWTLKLNKRLRLSIAVSRVSRYLYG